MDSFKNSMQKFRLFGRGKSVKHNLKKCRLYRKNGMVGAAGVRYYLDIGAGAACDPYKTFTTMSMFGLTDGSWVEAENAFVREPQDSIAQRNADYFVREEDVHNPDKQS